MSLFHLQHSWGLTGGPVKSVSVPSRTVPPTTSHKAAPLGSSTTSQPSHTEDQPPHTPTLVEHAQTKPEPEPPLGHAVRTPAVPLPVGTLSAHIKWLLSPVSHHRLGDTTTQGLTLSHPAPCSSLLCTPPPEAPVAGDSCVPLTGTHYPLGCKAL